ncbi:MAG: TonB-dependent receptor plug domain-containing protein, partial [Gammaproteobacteria bacterium]
MQDLKTILLVEDHPNDVEPTLEALADYRLANDNRGGQRRRGDPRLPLLARPVRGARARASAVVLLDLKMPKVDALAVPRTVKADPASKPIPIVMLTSSCQDRGLVESYPLGANKRGRRIHRAGTWAGGLCASLLALAAVNCRAGETAPAPAESGVAQLKKLSLEELMDIEVTSVSKRPERLSETPSAIQVITQEDIRRSGATRLPEALRLASNLGVAQVDSSRWAISARGFNSPFSNKLLVLIDGRTVYTPLFAGVRWEVQDTLLEDIDRIEVISGSGATLWGANAVNGVINIITRDAKDTQGALLAGGGGTELRGFGGMRYGGALTPNLRYRVYGKYFDRDSSVLPDGRDASDDWHMGQGGFRMDWDASESNVFTVQGDGYDGRISQAGADEI